MLLGGAPRKGNMPRKRSWLADIEGGVGTCWSGGGARRAYMPRKRCWFLGIDGGGTCLFRESILFV